MTFFAFQVYYLGRDYCGYQRQFNGQTVENYLELALIKSGYIFSFKENKYKGASRTDAGVNALGNVFVLNLEKKPNLLKINYWLPDSILLWSYAEVDANFNPRVENEKRYRYIIPMDFYPNVDLSNFKEYMGKHDFTPFIRKYGAGMQNPISDIRKIEIKENEGFIIIDIVGNSFGREQIRRMVGLFLDEKHNESSPMAILNQGRKIDVKTAPAEYLTLISIRYTPRINWKIVKKLKYRVERHMAGYEAELTKSQVYVMICRELIGLFQ